MSISEKLKGAENRERRAQKKLSLETLEKVYTSKEIDENSETFVSVIVSSY